MGVLAHVASDASEDTAVVGQAIASWFPSAAAAFSFLLFNLLDSPCLAAIGTMAAEMNDRKWFWFAILYQNVFAYVASLIVYQLWILRANGFTSDQIHTRIQRHTAEDPYRKQYNSSIFTICTVFTREIPQPASPGFSFSVILHSI